MQAVILTGVALAVAVAGLILGGLLRASHCSSAAPGSYAVLGPGLGCALPSWITSGLPTVLFMGAAVIVPPLVGAFVGVPLVAQETERQTLQIVWSQSVTRRRWFLTQLGLLASGALVIGGLLAAGGWAWVSAALAPEFGGAGLWDGFQAGPAIVVADTLFSLALGISVGSTIRRLVPAMITTLVVYAVVLGLIAGVARPNYLPPLTVRQSELASLFSSPPHQAYQPSSWIVNVSYVDATGHSLSGATIMQTQQVAFRHRCSSHRGNRHRRRPRRPPRAGTPPTAWRWPPATSRGRASGSSR